MVWLISWWKSGRSLKTNQVHRRPRLPEQIGILYSIYLWGLVVESSLGWIPGLFLTCYDRDNFLCERFFLFYEIKTDSVNKADSRDTKLLIEFPWNPILNFLLEFWNCVGSTQMRRCFVFQITHCDFLITPVILVYISGATFFVFACFRTYFVTQAIWTPVIFIFSRFLIQNHFPL